MSNTKKVEKKSHDILDDIKRVEKILTQQLLVRVISQLKQEAKETLKRKIRVKLMLKEVGISDDDAKRVIDFVNELPEVKLTEEEVKEIRDSVRESVRRDKSKVQKKMEEVAPPVNAFYQTALSSGNVEKIRGLRMTTGGAIAGNEDWLSDQSGVTLTNSSNNESLNLKV